MIRKFSCINFKNVMAEDLDCAGINLLIGPNNGGKSNFLRALSFPVFPSVDGKSSFLERIKRNGGVNILRQQADNRTVFFEWTIYDTKRTTIDYRMAFTVGESIKNVRLTEESLVESDGAVRHISIQDGLWNCMQRRQHLTSIGDSRVLALHTFFEQVTLFLSSSFDYTKIRQLQTPDTGDRILSDNGENFLNVYQTACGMDQEFQFRFLNAMRDLSSDIIDIQLEEGLGKIGMKLVFRNGPFWLSEVSDGTVEALLMSLLLTLPSELAPTVLCLDEPELSLHPAWQAKLARQIQMSGSFRQCFISTHSPDFLDSFTEGFRRGEVGILVCGSKGGNRIERLEPEKLEPELSKGWMLGDLYRVNDPLIGGWPY